MVSPLQVLWRTVRERWLRYHLALPEFAFVLDPAPPGEWISLDCETTGLKIGTDEIVSIGAVRIVGDRILTSERFEVLVKPQGQVSAQSIRIHRLREKDVAQGLPVDNAVKRLLHFIGPRPLVGYYLEFDVAMLNRVVFPLLGFGLPQPQIEVSALYHAHKMRQLPLHQRQSPPEIDLRLATLMKDLALPMLEAHNPVNDAVMAAMAFIKLRHLKQAKLG
jgi:DNA polymerase III subunit epsilon